MSLLVLVLLLDTAIEKESYVSVLLRFFTVSAQSTFEYQYLTGDVGLLEAFLGYPLCEYISHGLRRECSFEREVCAIARHRRNTLSGE